MIDANGHRVLTDLTGRQVGSLTVRRLGDKIATPSGERYWLCRCACGNRSEVRGDYLRAAKVLSCRECGSRRSGETRRAKLLAGAS